MTRDELLAFHKVSCVEAHMLMVAKNHDYAGADGLTPFANFEACEKLGICSTETGMLVRMCDKFMRLVNFAKSGTLKVKDESAHDTCLDLINYAILFDAYRIGKESQCAESATFQADTATGAL